MTFFNKKQTLSQPLISVIIPVYNSSNTVEAAVLSIIKQTYPNIEIIIIDDNSTDDTENKIASLMKNYENIKHFKLLHNDSNRFNKKGVNINAGFAARNFGIDHASGEWITFQDSDDASLLNRIEIQYNFAKKYKSSHVCIQWLKFDEKYLYKKFDIESFLIDQKYTVIKKESIIRLAKKSKGLLPKLMGRSHKFIPFAIKQAKIANKLFFGSLEPYPGSANCPLVKKELAKKIKFSPLSERVWPSFVGRGADRDFNFKIAELCKDSVCVNTPLYLWRKKTDNLLQNAAVINKYII